jgi:hypothetical protein
VRVLLLISLLLVACKPKRPPPPPPSVHIRRTSPIVNERFTYAIKDSLKIVMTDGTNTLDAIEENDSQAEEVITGVRGFTVTDRTVRFIAFHHKPLTAEAPLDVAVVGKTYRVGPNRAYSTSTGAPVTADERAALDAFVRDDTGALDLVLDLLTDRSFTKGVPWRISEDQPAPFARGLHAGASITFSEMANTKVRFDVEQIRVLELANAKIPITLKGVVVIDIGTARIDTIDIEGHIIEPTGPVKEAHLVSQQTFTYPR